MSAPVPGSSEDRVARKRRERAVNWAVIRGRQMSTPEEARRAVEIAREGLAQLRKMWRFSLLWVLPALPIAGMAVAFDNYSFHVLVFLAASVLPLLLTPFYVPFMQRRYERAIELNAPLAERD